MRTTPILAAAAVVVSLLAAAPAGATFPGANGVLSFQRPVGPQVDLFTLAATGGPPVRLTRTATWEEKAEWSPDGRRLAFARSAPKGSPTEIAVLDVAQNRVAALNGFGSMSAAPTWSPAGKIAFFSLYGAPPGGRGAPPPAELYSADADGSGARRLTRDRAIQTDPQWSPDGSAIAYSQWRAVPGRPGVFDIGVSLMNPDGTNQRPLLPAIASRDIATQSWSPDGRRLAVEWISATPKARDGRDRQSDIAVVNADGTGLQFLTRTAALETEPVWSPDGTMIAFASDRHVARGRRLERNGPAFELYTMRADGGDVRRLTRNDVPDLYPDWQPVSPAPR